MGSQHSVTRVWCMILAVLMILITNPAILQASDNIPRMSIQELKEKMDRGEKIFILDVRSGEDYASSMFKIKDAVRIPVDSLEDRYQELPKDVEIIAYCA